MQEPPGPVSEIRAEYIPLSAEFEYTVCAFTGGGAVIGLVMEARLPVLPHPASSPADNKKPRQEKTC
jgi:hypothetical protein